MRLTIRIVVFLLFCWLLLIGPSMLRDGFWTREEEQYFITIHQLTLDSFVPRLEKYKEKHGTYPTTEQGLTAVLNDTQPIYVMNEAAYYRVSGIQFNRFSYPFKSKGDFHQITDPNHIPFKHLHNQYKAGWPSMFKQVKVYPVKTCYIVTAYRGQPLSNTCVPYRYENKVKTSCISGDLIDKLYSHRYSRNITDNIRIVALDSKRTLERQFKRKLLQIGYFTAVAISGLFLMNTIFSFRRFKIQRPFRWRRLIIPIVLLAGIGVYHYRIMGHSFRESASIFYIPVNPSTVRKQAFLDSYFYNEQDKINGDISEQEYQRRVKTLDDLTP